MLAKLLRLLAKDGDLGIFDLFADFCFCLFLEFFTDFCLGGGNSGGKSSLASLVPPAAESAAAAVVVVATGSAVVTVLLPPVLLLLLLFCDVFVVDCDN